MHALTELFYQKHALPTTRLKGNCCKVPSVLSVCLHALNQVTHGNKVMQVIREQKNSNFLQGCVYTEAGQYSDLSHTNDLISFVMEDLCRFITTA